MKLLIRSILGAECCVDVEPKITISDLKKIIEKKITIPAVKQTIVLSGTVLQDERKIESYTKIKDGTKLFIVLKKQETLNSALTKFLQQYYTIAQVNLIIKEFMDEFNNKVNNLSLDDLERIATADMENCLK